MSETVQIPEAPAPIVPAEAPLTALAAALGTAEPGQLAEARGVRTFSVFSDASGELSALVREVAAFDQGARVRLRITGEDRVRWLNGMVTNSVKALAPGSHHYTFVLNAQGRIQGDATIFAFADHLILETDAAQAERVFAHLDRFIIMDDVELAWVARQTTLGLAGPGARELLTRLGWPVPEEGTFAIVGGITIVAEYSPAVPRYSLWIADSTAATVWQQLLAAGARPAGTAAVDALRILEGTPLYGVDISEKTLAQETGQMRALNFNKGCYLGQEIVERIRSRASVHRGIRQFVLEGAPAAAGTQLFASSEGAPAPAAVGELTSVAAVTLPITLPATLPDLPGPIALGIVRVESLDRPGASGVLTYAGGSARALPHSPLTSPAANAPSTGATP